MPLVPVDTLTTVHLMSSVIISSDVDILVETPGREGSGTGSGGSLGFSRIGEGGEADFLDILSGS